MIPNHPASQPSSHPTSHPTPVVFVNGSPALPAGTDARLRAGLGLPDAEPARTIPATGQVGVIVLPPLRDLATRLSGAAAGEALEAWKRDGTALLDRQRRNRRRITLISADMAWQGTAEDLARLAARFGLAPPEGTDSGRGGGDLLPATLMMAAQALIASDPGAGALADELGATMIAPAATEAATLPPVAVAVDRLIAEWQAGAQERSLLQDQVRLLLEEDDRQQVAATGRIAGLTQDLEALQAERDLLSSERESLRQERRHLREHVESRHAENLRLAAALARITAAQAALARETAPRPDDGVNGVVNAGNEGPAA